MSDSTIATIVLGAVCALACWRVAAAAFDDPTWARTYTTFSGYHLARVGHSAFYILVLLCSSTLIALLASALFKISNQYSALVGVVVALIAAVPIIKTYRSPRSVLQRLGGVPRVAAHFAKQLAEGELQPPKWASEEAARTLRARGISTDGSWLPIAEPMQARLLRLAAVFLQIRAWSGRRRVSGFLFEAKLDMDRLRQRFDRVSIRASRVMCYCDRLAAIRSAVDTQATNDSVRTLVQDIVADVSEDVTILYEDVCLFVARAAMSTCVTRKGRTQFVRRLGFDTTKLKRTAGVGILLATALMMFVGIVFLFLAFPGPVNDLHFWARVITVTVITLGSIAIAVLPKLHWGFANGGLNAKTPISFVFGAGVTAALFAITVNLIVGLALHGNWQGAMTRLHNALPWLPGSFITAASLAWLIQDYRWPARDSTTVRRLLDGAVLGTVWVLETLLANLLITPELRTQPLLGAVCGSFSLGFIVGVIVPEWARSDELRAVRRMTASAPSVQLPAAT